MRSGHIISEHGIFVRLFYRNWYECDSTRLHYCSVILFFPPIFMDILTFLFIGLVAGWLAGEISRGRGFGIVGNILVGIVGALFGGFIFRLVGVEAYGFIGNIVMAVIGAVVLLFLIGLVRKNP